MMAKQSKILKNTSVRIGLVALILLLCMAVFAPWLYTIEPTAMDPSSANLLPGVTAEFSDLSGDTFDHLFPMGTDSLGRDTWSRVAYGARISLTVGLCVAVLSLIGGTLCGVAAGLDEVGAGGPIRGPSHSHGAHP